MQANVNETLTQTAKNINILLKAYNYTIARLAKEAEIPENDLRDFLTFRQLDQLDMDSFLHIAFVLQISPAWLFMPEKLLLEQIAAHGSGPQNSRSK